MIAIFRTSPPTKENRRRNARPHPVPGQDEAAPGIQVNRSARSPASTNSTKSSSPTSSFPRITCWAKSTAPWKQATGELAYERSRPGTLSGNLYVLTELVRAVGKKSRHPQRRRRRPAGRAIAHHAPDVGIGGGHVAGRQGSRWWRRPSSRTSARCGNRRCRIASADLAAFVEETATNRETLEDQLSFAIKTAPKLTIQGRHHRSIARHHRPRGLVCAKFQRTEFSREENQIKSRARIRSVRRTEELSAPLASLSLGEGACLPAVMH